ncbi:MAG: hypothetical protein E7370_02730 [Clostridiales bacterium]|nr:hypothetical protein [Clostridiales bacterium]
MKKYLNARLPLLFAIALIIGVVAGYAIFYYNINAVWLTVTFFVLAVGLIALLIYKGSKKKLIVISIVIACLFLGAVNCLARFSLFENNSVVDGGKYQIEGTIILREEAAEGAYITIGLATANGEGLGGNIKAFIHESCMEGCDIGKLITFYTAIEKQHAINYGNFNYESAENIKYFCRVYYGVGLSQGFYPFGTVNNEYAACYLVI